MGRAHAGDVAAVRELFDRHSGPLLGYAFCLLRNQKSAEEIVQEVFLDLYRYREHRDGAASVPAFLFRAVTRACLESFERAATADGWQWASDATAESSAIATALGRLSPRQRAAFLLSRMRGLDLADIADCLDVAPETVKSLIRGAMGVVLDELRSTAGVFSNAR
ncbi:MAG: RNA polymerase sigma factor [Candidatus Binatia bacterium]